MAARDRATTGRGAAEAPLVLTLLAAVLAAGATACAAPRPPAPVEGCETVAFTAGRCSLVVEAAAAELPAFHPRIVAVRVHPPTDRQLDLSGRRVIVANVEFTFDDGTRRSIGLDCLADDGTPACEAP